MDVTTFIGIILAGSLVLSSILMGGSGTWFLNYPSMMIVIGGTIGATLLNYPLHQVMKVFGIVKNAFLHKAESPNELISMIVDFSKKARREGILSFESQIKDIQDPFLSKGLQLAIDGMESQSIEEIMSTEIQFGQERHKLGAEIECPELTYLLKLFC